MENNPYAPPKAEVVDVGPEEVELASRGRRFANMVIDTIAIYILAFVVGIFLVVFEAPFLDDPSPLNDYAFGILLWIAYYVPLEVLFGRTVGKLITGTRVIMTDGAPPNVLNVVGRTFARLVPFEAFSFFGADVIGWHDRWSRTRVVRIQRGR
jgi:uncharacterized RDD family membrane protein YckC